MSWLKKSAVPTTMLALIIGAGGLQAQTASPLVATPSAVSLSCQLGGSPGAAATVAVTATVSNFFYVDTSTVPAWLTVGTTTGTATSVATNLSFQGSGFCLTMNPGVYTASVNLDVLTAGVNPKAVAVTLTVQAVASSLTVTVASATPSSMAGTCTFTPTSATVVSETCTSWGVSSAAPVFNLALVSSSAPISYSVATALTTPSSGGYHGVTNPASVAKPSGVAYSWGTSVAVTFSTPAFFQALSGDSVVETVTVTPAGGTAIVLTITLTVTPPVATVTSTNPSSAAVDAVTTDTLTVAVSGAGFVTGTTGGAQTSMVYYCYAASGACSAFTDLQTTGVTVVNANTIILALSTGLSSANYLGTAGEWIIGVCNPNGASSCTPTGTAVVTVSSSPIISAVTSASTFAQTSPTFAPFDIVSIFGTNFCPDCGGSNPTSLTGTVDSTFRYPTTLTPDPGSTPHLLSVAFNDNTNTLIAQGYLLFANNTQINVLVPSAVSSKIGTANAVRIVVSYGLTGSLAASPYYATTVSASDPGIFTENSTGSGQGAILNFDFSVNSVSVPATHTTTVAGHNLIMIYMTGMGAPTSAASNANSTSAATFPASCVALASSGSGSTAVIGYLATENTAYSTSYTTLDGVVVQSAKLATNRLPPCFATAPTVTIGGVSAVVGYAGWVADSVSGLYQLNVTVPSTVTLVGSTTTALPVVVTFGGKSSQLGVTAEIN